MTSPAYNSDATLLSMVRNVASHGRPENPTTISQRAFDAARADAGHPQCPRATNLCRRFDSGWADLVELAFRERTGFRARVSRSRAKGSHQGQGTDHATAVGALASMAARLKLETLRPEQYSEGREQLLRSARGKRRASLQVRFPTYGQFRVLGDWDTLLMQAGLAARPPAEELMVPDSEFIDLIEQFLEAQGHLPGYRRLKKFAAERGNYFPNTRTERFREAYAELKSRRDLRGLWTPPTGLSRGMRPPWQPLEPSETAPVSPVRPHDAKTHMHPRDHWSLERVQAGLELAASKLQPGERLNQPTLRRLAKEDKAIPQPSRVGSVAKRNGTTFSALRDAAVEAQRPSEGG